MAMARALSRSTTPAAHVLPLKVLDNAFGAAAASSQSGLRLATQRETQVGVDRALMEFVEGDGTHAAEIRLALQTAYALQ